MSTKRGVVVAVATQVLLTLAQPTVPVRADETPPGGMQGVEGASNTQSVTRTAAKPTPRISPASFDTQEELVRQLNNDSTKQGGTKLSALEPVPAAESPQLDAPLSHSSLYDAKGNVTTRIDANGNTTLYTYDELDRIVRIDYPDGTFVARAYDVNGNRTSLTDPTGITHYEYDLLDRLIAITYPDSKVLRIAYDLLSRVSDLAYVDGTAVHFWYWKDGRIQEISRDNALSGFQYDAAGRLVFKGFVNGCTTRYGYDQAGRLVQIRHEAPGGELISQFDYTLDKYGNRIQIVKTGSTSGPMTASTTAPTEGTGISQRSEQAPEAEAPQLAAPDAPAVTQTRRPAPRVPEPLAWATGVGAKEKASLVPAATETMNALYDTMDRLTQVTYPDGRTASYTFDDFNNRTSKTEVVGDTRTLTTYDYDANNRLVRIRINENIDEEFTYDGNGNMTSRKRFGHITYYRWDFENRLTAVIKPSGERVEYIYNGEGKLWQRKVIAETGTTTTNFYATDSPDMPMILNEYTLETGRGAAHVYANETLIESVVQEGSGAAYASYLTGEYNTANITELRDIDGNRLFPLDYPDVYGPSTRGVVVGALAPGYIGEFLDAETHLQFLRARWYEPTLGVFVSQDQMKGDQKTPYSLFVRYVYGNHNPLRFVDRTGNQNEPPLEEDWVTILLAAAGIYAIGAGAAAAEVVQGITGSIGGWWNAGWAAGSLAEPFHGPLLGGLAHVGLSRWGTWTGWHLGTFEVAERSLLHFYDTYLRIGAASGVNIPYWAVIGAFFSWPEQAEGEDLAASSPGGVRLDKSATTYAEIGEITGATFDPATGQLVLHGTDRKVGNLPGMRMDDLAMSIRLVFDHGVAPEVSLDPVPGQDWHHRWRYGPPDRPYLTDDTHMGWVMMEADRVLKYLSLGVKPWKTDEVLPEDFIPGYRSFVDRLVVCPCKGAPFGQRFWLHPDDIVIEESPDGGAIKFVHASIMCSTEDAILPFASGDPVAEAAAEFATWITLNWEELRAYDFTPDDPTDSNVFQELEGLSKVFGVVQWIKDSGIPFDTSWVSTYDVSYIERDTPQFENVTQVQLTWLCPPGIECGVTITGGVFLCKELTINGVSVPVPVLSARPDENTMGWTFVDPSDGTEQNAAAVSVGRSFKDGAASRHETDLSADGRTGKIGLVRHYDSFDVAYTPSRWSWEPVLIRPKGKAPDFIECDGQSLFAPAGLFFMDKERTTEFRFGGTYDHAGDPQGIMQFFSYFNPSSDIMGYFDAGLLGGGYFWKDGTIYADFPSLSSGDHEGPRSGWLYKNRTEDLWMFFDPEGRLLWVRDSHLEQTNYVRDPEGRLTLISDGAASISLNYASDRLVSASASNGTGVNYSYDVNGRLEAAQLDTGQRVQYVYDSDGLLTQAIDENGFPFIGLANDVYGRAESTDVLGFEDPFSSNFSLETRSTQQSGPLGNWVTQYDENFLPARTVDPLGHETETIWNDLKLLITRIDGKGTPHEQRTDFYYTSVGDPLAERRPNGEVELTLRDFDGRVTSTMHLDPSTTFLAENFNAQHIFDGYGFLDAANPSDQFDYFYTAAGKLRRKTARALGFDVENYTYDAQGRMKTSSDAEGRTRRYSFDEDGDGLDESFARVSRITNDLGEYVAYTYDSRDRRNMVTNGILPVHYEFDDRDRISAFVQGEPGGFGAPPDVRHRTEYVIDPVYGVLVSVKSPNEAMTVYTYNDRKLLAAITHVGRLLYEYDYDGGGRVAKVSFRGTVGGTLSLEKGWFYDIDGDGLINEDDLDWFATAWQKAADDPTVQYPPNARFGLTYDYDMDGFVGPDDLSFFSTGWMRTSSDPAIVSPPVALWSQVPSIRLEVTPSLGLTDYAAFYACLAGPHQGVPAPTCTAFDYDTDSDIDLRDFAVFQRYFSEGRVARATASQEDFTGIASVAGGQSDFDTASRE